MEIMLILLSLCIWEQEVEAKLRSRTWISPLISMTWRQSLSVCSQSKSIEKCTIFVSPFNISEMEDVVHENTSSPVTPSSLKPCTGIWTSFVSHYPNFELLRLVNSDGQAFIKRFQPEISRQVAPVLENYVNMWVQTKNLNFLLSKNVVSFQRTQKCWRKWCILISLQLIYIII